MEQPTTMPAIPRSPPLETKNGPGAAIRLPARELLRDQAYAAIKRFILDGELAPGAFLAERQLAGQLRMSKTPVRAALQRLEAEGFVTVSPQQGIIIRVLTVPEIAEHYELRAALETYVVRALAGHLLGGQRDRLEENLRAQAALRGRDDGLRVIALDTEFHILFCEFLGNQEILKVMAQLREKIQRAIIRVFQLEAGRFASSYEEHRAIADAVTKGDAALAARLVEEHLEYARRCLLSTRHP
jgi:DNA-binding GntR family transcriptional regulator